MKVVPYYWVVKYSWFWWTVTPSLGWLCCCCSVTKSCPTLCDQGLQHTKPLCPSPSPRVFPSSCSLNWWCHPTISSLSPSFPSTEGKMSKYLTWSWGFKWNERKNGTENIFWRKNCGTFPNSLKNIYRSEDSANLKEHKNKLCLGPWILIWKARSRRKSWV